METVEGITLQAVTEDSIRHEIKISWADGRAKTLKDRATNLLDEEVHSLFSHEDRLALIGIEAVASARFADGLRMVAGGYEDPEMGAKVIGKMQTDLEDAIIVRVSEISEDQFLDVMVMSPRTEGVEFSNADFDKMTLPEMIILFRVLGSANNFGKEGGKSMTLSQYESGFRRVAEIFGEVKTHVDKELQRYLKTRTES